MQFGIVQQERFNAKVGSYSIVTDREVDDSQITATDAETELLQNYFSRKGKRIFIGNVKSSNGAAATPFRLFPTGQTIFLNLVYPKKEKSELRLYLSNRAGFKPSKGYVWFMFIDNNDDLWIGHLPEKEWRKENSTYRKTDPSISAEGDIIINDETEDEVVTETHTTQYWQRKRAFALKRMQLSKFKCEFDSTHKLFISRSTGCPFLESHHVVPIRFQANFQKKNLDSIDNLCCLCPTCHRAIHHAEESYAREIIQKLVEKRDIETKFNLLLNEMYRLYAVEEILR